MKNILEKSKHFVKLETSLELNNKIFPYPPGTFYKWNCVPELLVSKKQHYDFLSAREGGSVNETVLFTCTKKGKYNVEIVKMKSGYYNEAEKTEIIEIICID